MAKYNVAPMNLFGTALSTIMFTIIGGLIGSMIYVIMSHSLISSLVAVYGVFLFAYSFEDHHPGWRECFLQAFYFSILGWIGSVIGIYLIIPRWPQ